MGGPIRAKRTDYGYELSLGQRTAACRRDDPSGGFSIEWAPGESTGILTLRACKAAFAARCDDPAPPPATPVAGAWDCADPAWLLLLLSRGEPVPDAVIQRTLECYGCIDPQTGEADLATARQDLRQRRHLRPARRPRAL